MRTVTYRLDDLKDVVIHIGRAEENLATRVRIDAGKVFAEYPAAVPTMKVINPAGTVYGREVSRDGDMVIWDVTESDLAAEGQGEMQLTFTENSVIVKSADARTEVCRSIVGGTTPPDPVQDWIDRAEEVLEEVEDAFPEGGTTGQVLAKKSNADFDTEWVDQGSGGTTDYAELTNKPQIAGVTLTGNKSLHDLGAAAESDIPDVSGFYTKPAGGIPASDIADGVIPDPEDLINDESTAANKVLSAQKVSGELADVKSAITQNTNTLDGVLTTSDNVFDGVFVLDEQVATSSGKFVAGNGYMRSDYISITSGVVTVGIQEDTVKGETVIVHYGFYNSSKEKVSTGLGNVLTVYTADDMKYQQITVPSGAAYFAFDASKVKNYGDNFYVSQVMYPEKYVPYSTLKNIVKPTSIKIDKTLTQNGLPADAKIVGDKLNKDEKAITAIRGGNLTTVKAASLAQGEGIYSVRNALNRNKTYIFNAKVSGDSWSILVAHSPVDDTFDSNNYSQGFVITPTTATAWTNGNDGEGGTLGSAWTHNLTIEARLTVIIAVGNDGLFTLYLMSENGLVHKDYSYTYIGRKGTIYAKSIAGTFTDAELSFSCSDLEKPVWIFGDSYMSISDDRWPYWLIQTKTDNFLINSYPGEGTTNAILDLKALLNLATPRFIVWAQGMNDKDTSSAVNSTWLAGVEELIEICESKGITLILATIPNVASTSPNNVKKNAWVQASGYRYVDFNKAIGAADEPGASWPAGWLSNDNLHPTAMGARVLAGQILLDVPELTMP